MAVTVRTLENFICGEWVPSTGDSAREIVSPVTGETLAETPDASQADIDRAVAAARDAQPKWAALSAWDRAKVCHAIADLIDERREEFARELSLEQGKPYAAKPSPTSTRRRRTSALPPRTSSEWRPRSSRRRT
jgi:acyl-CoA reductase-like NAD-dependent aldehyde dehydrogenase